MRRVPRPAKRVRKPKRRRQLEPADLDDQMDEHELEDWMIGAPGGK